MQYDDAVLCKYIYKPKTIQLNFTLTTIEAVSSKVIQYNNKMQTE